MICASITRSTVESMVRKGNKTTADLVEVRLDHLRSLKRLDGLSAIKKPVIATCMPAWEGGLFKGGEGERIALLERTLDFASYVTIELRTMARLRDALIRKARSRGVGVIVAYHDFKKTPSKNRILSIIRRELGLGDVAKVAFMPKSQADVFKVIDILLEKKTTDNVIALSMGKLGRITRILGPLLGSYLTYGSVSRGREAGPGQLTVDEIRKSLSALTSI